MESVGSIVLWATFAVFVMGALFVDLFVVGGGRSHRVSPREALAWSSVWVALSLVFALGIWIYIGAHHGPEEASTTVMEYLTGYVIEYSLSVDNVFVWLMLFSYFRVPIELQKRVLLYGVIGAIVMRTGIIFAGTWLIAEFHWILYFFGAFLLLTGIRMYFAAEGPPDLEQNRAVRWLRRHLDVTTELHGDRFFVILNGVRHATPLLLALVLVEISDLIFAVDSIPAIFAITTDPFVVLTSNVFAILGLRSMYFLLADAADRFSLLKFGLATVLIFIGVKMLLIDIYKVPVGFSLAVVVAILLTSILASLRKARREERAAAARLGNGRNADL